MNGPKAVPTKWSHGPQPVPAGQSTWSQPVPRLKTRSLCRPPTEGGGGAATWDGTHTTINSKNRYQSKPDMP